MKLIDTEKLKADLMYHEYKHATITFDTVTNNIINDTIIEVLDIMNEQPIINAIDIEGRANIPCHVCDIYLEARMAEEKIKHLQEKNAQL